MWIRYAQIILFSLLATVSGIAVAGALAGTTSPIDVDLMANYAPQDYVEPVSGRDPFTTTDKMFRVSAQPGANGAANQGFVPFMSTEPLPKMRIKGFVHNGPGEAMALLQIDGDDTVHLVRKGDEIGIQSRAGQLSSVLKIINVDLKKVEVQSGSLKQVIIVQ